MTSSGTPLGQDQIWTDKSGTQHLVSQMSVRYKQNVVTFLDRRAPRIVGRASADHYIANVSKMFEPVPCVMCPPSAGGGIKPASGPPTRKIHRWEHGVDHLMVDPDKYPDEVDAMIPDPPSVTNAEAIAIVRRTPLVVRLLDDIANDRGGRDDGLPPEELHLLECPWATRDYDLPCSCNDFSPEWTTS